MGVADGGRRSRCRMLQVMHVAADLVSSGLRWSGIGLARLSGEGCEFAQRCWSEGTVDLRSAAYHCRGRSTIIFGLADC